MLDAGCWMLDAGCWMLDVKGTKFDPLAIEWRNGVLGRMKTKIALVLIPLLFISSSLIAQDVRRLEVDQAPGKGTIHQLDWLAGYWTGTGLGGDVDEVWLPAADSSMTGIFRLFHGGRIRFSEYMMIIEGDSTLLIRLKHFNRDLSPWEEKDDWTEFRLVAIEDQAAYFHGLTYQRTGDSLAIHLSMRNRERSWIETFRFVKEEL